MTPEVHTCTCLGSVTPYRRAEKLDAIFGESAVASQNPTRITHNLWLVENISRAIKLTFLSASN
ncbi:hypothetical protein E6H17_07425 [Candidatus Bathyarchaeota archaeon]|nr:MAG: hypothetical protein E6H17_07425 [Candidatus Bathyarchaeota archaeon]